MTTIDDLRAEFARERAAHAATRQVLEDAVRDRGGVVVLSAEQQRAVFAALALAAGGRPCCWLRTSPHGRAHDMRCSVARALRIIGGPEETQRQVDAAHAEALALTYERLTGMASLEPDCFHLRDPDIIDGDPRE